MELKILTTLIKELCGSKKGEFIVYRSLTSFVTFPITFIELGLLNKEQQSIFFKHSDLLWFIMDRKKHWL